MAIAVRNELLPADVRPQGFLQSTYKVNLTKCAVDLVHPMLDEKAKRSSNVSQATCNAGPHIMLIAIPVYSVLGACINPMHMRLKGHAHVCMCVSSYVRGCGVGVEGLLMCVCVCVCVLCVCVCACRTLPLCTGTS